MFMNCRFYNEKIENIPEMNLGKFDFIESTGTGCLSSLHAQGVYRVYRCRVFIESTRIYMVVYRVYMHRVFIEFTGAGFLSSLQG